MTIISPDTLSIYLIIITGQTAMVASNSRFQPTVVFGVSVVTAGVLTKIFIAQGPTKEQLDFAIVSIIIILVLGMLPIAFAWQKET